VNKGKFVHVEGRHQSRSYEDRQGQRREVTEVVVTTLRFLGPSKNGHGAKAAEPSKSSEPVNESENPFNEPGSEIADQDIPF
jgi:single-strand DNA-binding protein